MAEKTSYNAETSIRPYAWVILVVVFFASIAGPLNQAKVPPLIPVIMDTYQLSLGEAGWLMSVFSLTGLFLALPAGLLLQRFGPKKLGVIALGCLTVGSAMGALSNDPGIFLFSRVIEGSGMGLIAVVAPAAIAMWFPKKKQGIAMGIWSTWVPVGTVVIYVLAPALAAWSSLQMVWWSGAVYSFLVLLIFAIFMRLPPWVVETSRLQSEPSIQAGYASVRKALNKWVIWGLGLVFACFTFINLALRTFYPTFLSDVRGYSLSEAALIASIATLTMLFSAPLAGWISDKIGSRRLVFSFPFLILSVMLFFPFKIFGWQIITFMILQGLVAGAIPTAVFAAAPEIMIEPELAGWGMSVVMLGQNLGFFIGPIFFGMIVEGPGWVIAGYTLIPICLLGFVVGLKLKTSKH